MNGSSLRVWLLVLGTRVGFQEKWVLVILTLRNTSAGELLHSVLKSLKGLNNYKANSIKINFIIIYKLFIFTYCLLKASRYYKFIDFFTLHWFLCFKENTKITWNKNVEIPGINLVSDAEREKSTHIPTNILTHTPSRFLTFFKMVPCEITFTTYLWW